MAAPTTRVAFLARLLVLALALTCARAFMPPAPGANPAGQPPPQPAQGAPRTGAWGG
jgi:hypothetical protein